MRSTPGRAADRPRFATRRPRQSSSETVEQEGGSMNAVGEVRKLIQERDLSTIAAKFRESGLDEHVQSWVSKGKNLPVAGDQIERALGSDVVARIGAKLGITQVEAAD